VKISTLLISALTVIAAPAFAAQPNQYICANAAKHMNVIYSSSSFMGQPEMTISVNDQSIVPGNAEQSFVSLSAQSTMLGQFVTADVISRVIADGPSSVYSLIVPGIILGDAPIVKFETKLLIGVNNGGRAVGPVVLQHITDVISLKCVAQSVQF
jgi:hypothetical protein